MTTFTLGSTGGSLDVYYCFEVSKEWCKILTGFSLFKYILYILSLLAYTVYDYIKRDLPMLMHITTTSVSTNESNLILSDSSSLTNLFTTPSAFLLLCHFALRGFPWTLIGKFFFRLFFSFLGLFSTEANTSA